MKDKSKPGDKPTGTKKKKHTSSGDNTGKKRAASAMSPAMHASATPHKLEKLRAKLLRRCAGLLDCENLLEAFAAEVKRLGLVGEQRNAKLVFLALNTRFFSRPVSVAVKGTSSSGKNTLVDTVLKFFPSNAYHKVTGMSEKALAYFSHPLKNRFLYVSEAAGLKDGTGMVMLRNLLSDGHIRYEVTVGKTTRLIEIPGPTGLIVTTTELKLYHDDETRMFSVEVADTPAQNRRVLLAIAAQEASGESPPSKPAREWTAFLKWIAINPPGVLIPYSAAIADGMGIKVTRTRRDFKAFCALVRVHALLHQNHRKRDSMGRVVANFDDYRAVRAVAQAALAEGADATVMPAVREVVEAVGEIMARGKKGATTADLEAVLKLHKTNISRRTKAAVQAGYLRNLVEGQGRMALFVTDDPMPKGTDVLPKTSAVKARWRKTSKALKGK